MPAAEIGSPDNHAPIRILYAYCGEHRRGDIGDYIRQQAAKHQITVELEEVDLCRGGDAHDLTNDALAATLRHKVKERHFHAVIVTPPCNTHSRATYANRRGPRPLRSKKYPSGLPGLPKHLADKVKTADKLIKVALDLCRVAASVGTPYLVEHPEDLGATPLGVPASIWQSPDWRKLADESNAITAALFQCHKLRQDSSAPTADYPKPTRLMTTMPLAKSLPFQGWPIFDDLNQYQGPLPRWCGHKHARSLLSVKVNGNLTFPTAAAAAYPPSMCEAIGHFAFSAARLRQLAEVSPTTMTCSSCGSSVPWSRPCPSCSWCILCCRL